ncbi:MAG: hypothetical protein H0T72_07360 [Chloroflexia bacterium]|nr:hypothetical protein [Chloroflexia bacterium]
MRFVIQGVSRSPRPGPIPQRLAAAVAAVSLAGGIVLGFPGQGLTQADGTGAASPTACRIVNAVAEPVVAADPTVSPVASPVASPVIGDLATPVASPVAEAEPADPDAPLLDELAATSGALLACLNERNFELYAQLTSDTFRGQLFGSGQPLPADEFAVLAESFADTDNRIVEVAAFERIDDVTASVEVTYVSAFQQRTGIWTFAKEVVDGLDIWILQGEEVIPSDIPEGAATIDVTFEDNGYALDPASVASADVVLNLANPTGEDHEALVLSFEDGVTTATLLQSTSASLPEGVSLVGQATVLAGGEGTMLLTGLAPGEYTIVDLFPDENGNPHLSSGMMATFTVE